MHKKSKLETRTPAKSLGGGSNRHEYFITEIKMKKYITIVAMLLSMSVCAFDGIELTDHVIENNVIIVKEPVQIYLDRIASNAEGYMYSGFCEKLGFHIFVDEGRDEVSLAIGYKSYWITHEKKWIDGVSKSLDWRNELPESVEELEDRTILTFLGKRKPTIEVFFKDGEPHHAIISTRCRPS